MWNKFIQNLLTCASMSTEGYTGGMDGETILLGVWEQDSGVGHSMVWGGLFEPAGTLVLTAEK